MMQELQTPDTKVQHLQVSFAVVLLKHRTMPHFADKSNDCDKNTAPAGLSSAPSGKMTSLTLSGCNLVNLSSNMDSKARHSSSTRESSSILGCVCSWMLVSSVRRANCWAVELHRGGASELQVASSQSLIKEKCSKQATQQAVTGITVQQVVSLRAVQCTALQRQGLCSVIYNANKG